MDNDLIAVTNGLCAMDISKECVKPIKNNKAIKGPLDVFIIRQEVKDDSLTLSDFECDSVDLDLSDIVNKIIA